MLMVHTVRLEVPYEIWRIERAFSSWLEWREITGFFWEVDRNSEYVTIEVFD
jgi:hypothetical protein